MQKVILEKTKNEVLDNQIKNYNGIDLVKFICSFLICTIHVDPFPPEYFLFGENLGFFLRNYVCRLAVPFFFVASGFFLFRKMSFDNINKDVIKKYCFHIFCLLGVWYILLFLGSLGHLWYMKATIVAIVLLSFFINHNVGYKKMLVIAAVFYAIGLLGDSYYGIMDSLKQYMLFDYGVKAYELLFKSTRNGVFMGFVFVLIGALFARGKIKMNMKIAIAGFIVSMVLLFGEVFLLKHYGLPKDYNMYILLIPVTLFLFYIASEMKLKDRPIYKKIRVVGVLVYFSHLLVNYFVERGLEIIEKVTGVDLLPYEWIITILAVTILAFLVERLSQQSRFKWMQWLYS